MRTPITNLAPSRFEKPAEGAGTIGRVVFPTAHRTKPQIPIEFRRWRSIGLIATDRICVVPTSHLVHFADHAVANGAAGVVRAPTGASLCTDLHFAPVCTSGRDHGSPLLHGDR